jgi:hypothetical protein
MSNLNTVTQLTANIDSIRAHVESVRSEMGDAWAAEQLSYHEGRIVEAIEEYINTFPTAPEALKSGIRTNLLKQANITR